eukprot:1160502-Pelagomonas_calceolata.AAC.5
MRLALCGQSELVASVPFPLAVLPAANLSRPVLWHNEVSLMQAVRAGGICAIPSGSAAFSTGAFGISHWKYIKFLVAPELYFSASRGSVGGPLHPPKKEQIKPLLGIQCMLRRWRLSCIPAAAEALWVARSRGPVGTCYRDTAALCSRGPVGSPQH